MAVEVRAVLAPSRLPTLPAAYVQLYGQENTPIKILPSLLRARARDITFVAADKSAAPLARVNLRWLSREKRKGGRTVSVRSETGRRVSETTCFFAMNYG